MMKTLQSLLDERTVVGLCGLALLTIGAALVYVPLAFVVPGVALFGVAIYRPKSPSK